ncbi:MAG: type II toxin-antitoxin system Phd/YefM family antitoxin [Gammaproteobacteria bacterium]
MKTLTATKARQNLSHWLSRAIQGEDIGIVCGSNIVALRPVEVYAEDYALVEYGVTGTQLDRAVKTLNREARRERRRGKIKVWDGTAKGLRG